METCRVCGEQKPKLSFVKIKHWSRTYDKNLVWCRECQRMFLEMKELERKREELQRKSSHVVEFL